MLTPMGKSQVTSLFGFPRGFLPLTLVLTFGMAAFALVQSLVTLYCSEIFNFTDQQAYLTTIAFVTIIFTVPVIGGYLAQRLLGYVFTTIISLCLAVGGLFSLCFRSLIHL